MPFAVFSTRTVVLRDQLPTEYLCIFFIHFKKSFFAPALLPSVFFLETLDTVVLR